MPMRACLLLISMWCLTPASLADIATPSERSPDPDKLQLGSVAAVVMDTNTGESLYAKHPRAVVPIASITKVMMAMVVLDGGQSLDEYLEIRKPDLNTRKNAWSRMRIGSKAKRRDLLRLALMSSENLAAWTLGNHYPGGMTAFVAAMNTKARELGMMDSSFADTTGLLTENRSTAMDLGKMVVAASKYDLIRAYSTTAQYRITFRDPHYTLGYINTNPLIRRQSWDISLSKTGYLTEAGRCLVMLAEVDDADIVIVLLDSYGTRTPIGDAGRIRRWIETGNGGRIAGAALRYSEEKGARYE